jgi:dipeptidyl-peptidase-3
LEYATQFLGNCGNFKSFGDSKFIPRASEAAFAALAATSPKANEYYRATKGAIFSAENAGLMQLGYPPDHVSAYYPDSEGITKDDIVVVAAFMEDKKLLAVCSLDRPKRSVDVDEL